MSAAASAAEPNGIELVLVKLPEPKKGRRAARSSYETVRRGGF